MEYPVWHLQFWGGGAIIALVAVLHVYVAHFAVGGGLFLVLTEHLGYKRNSPAILDYVHRHAKFFLLLTMVFGGLTGVGIWLVISALSAKATSLLIHTFVFGWAAEWVCFFVEITALLVYYYGYRRLSRRDHLAAGWLYFIFAWLSLFLITGIIDFMLTPGAWTSTRSFWDGFFNPTFWPSLAFRTFLALSLAGIYGFVTAVRIKDGETRESVLRYTALWAAAPFVLVLASGFWYLEVLPPDRQAMVLETSPEIGPYLAAFPWLGLAIAAGGGLMALRFLPRPAKAGLAGVLLVLGLLYIGAFEFVREAARRPYLVTDVIYSSSILAGRESELQAQGALSKAKWVPFDAVTEDNRLEAGEWLFQMQCAPCHSIGGPLNDILPLTKGMPRRGVHALIRGLDTSAPYMPPFLGTDAEAGAVAAYIAEALHGVAPDTKTYALRELETAIPAFNATRDTHLLLAASGKGMHLMSDCDEAVLIRPPGSDLTAVLIMRDFLPMLVREGVTVRYSLPETFRDPAGRAPFWRYAGATLDRDVPANTGLQGAETTGTMAWDEESGVFRAQGIPAVPYPSDGGVNPYPLLTLEAVDQDGEVLAETRAVLPVSTEMGCRKCHGGDWKRDGAGVSRATAEAVLRVHDRKSDTGLLDRAEAGDPAACAECHPDEASVLPGRPELLSLSAAVHGQHAHYLQGQGGEACNACHPSSPDGVTRSFRGLHADFGFGCPDCHGTISDHAIALLKAEQDANKTRAKPLLQGLQPRMAPTAADVNPRKAWTQEPDCLGCHTRDFILPPLDAAAFNQWTDNAAGLYTNRKGRMGAVPCAACHGPQHAVYPASNPYGPDRDNAQPLQYMNAAGAMGFNNRCAVCHTDIMGFSAHHPNMLPE
jgi:mono/diheme cytochrome c family protein